MADMEFVAGDKSDEEDSAPVAGGEDVTPPRINDKQVDADGNWLPKGELRKKKAGKGWKKRYCCIVRQTALWSCDRLLLTYICQLPGR